MSESTCFVCEKPIEAGEPFQVLMCAEIIHSCTHNKCWSEVKNKLTERDLKILYLVKEGDLVT